jgi:hypothetical protein
MFWNKASIPALALEGVEVPPGVEAGMLGLLVELMP